MIYNKDNIQVYCGDLLDVLPTIEKVDCVATDPPYGLSFMGKAWDHSVPGPEYWQAIKESCKPGAIGGTAPKRWSRRSPRGRLARSSSQNACELILLAVARGGIESPTFPLFKPRRGYQ